MANLDIVVNESYTTEVGPARGGGNTELVRWIMSHVNQWQDYRDLNYRKRWEEYYRLWKGIWKAADSARKSERSKLISPALMQAIESTVSELEEATFGRKRWIDIEDDVDDADKQNMADNINRLLQEYDLNNVPAAISEVYLNGAIYGTGIAKVVTRMRQVRIPQIPSDTGEELSSIVDEQVSVLLEPIEPLQFVIDPLARTVDEALGCAHIMYIPKHTITLKQQGGIYAKGDVGAMKQDANFQAKGETQPVDLQNYTKVVEYHGLVPRELFELSTAHEEVEGTQTHGSQSADDIGVEYGEDEMIEVIVTIANDFYQLRAIENPNFMKDRNIIAYQHETVPNRFWGRGVSERGYAPQKALDAELRARIDSLAYALNPMIAMQASNLPAHLTNGFESYPGKVWITTGTVNDSIAPLNFTPPPLQSFQQSGDLERMVEMGTGAVQSAAPMTQNPRNSTASGISMMMSGFIKRSKRTLRNIERNFLTPWVKKSAWRYMQVDRKHFPVIDIKFRVNATLGIVAREFESQQLTQLLNTVPPESPAYWMILRSLFENSSVSSREALLPLINQMMQQAMQPKQPSMKEQAAMEDIRTKGEERHARSVEAKTGALLNLAKAEETRAGSIREDLKHLHDRYFTAQGDVNGQNGTQ